MKNKIFKHTISSTHKHLMFVFTFAFAFFCDTINMMGQCSNGTSEDINLQFNIFETGDNNNAYFMSGFVPKVNTKSSYNFIITVVEIPTNAYGITP